MISKSILILLFVANASAYLDLFLDGNETRQVFRSKELDGALFFVFDGETRPNILAHTFQLPPDKDDIEFSWRQTLSSVKQILQTSLWYRLEANDVLTGQTSPFVSFNINSVGPVPDHLSRFKVKFDCQARRKSSNRTSLNDPIGVVLNVSFKVNYSLPSSSYHRPNSLIDNLELTIIRMNISLKKTCKPDDDVKIVPLNKNANKSRTGTQFSGSFIVIITLVAFFLICLFVIFVMMTGNKKKRPIVSKQIDNDDLPRPIMIIQPIPLKKEIRNESRRGSRHGGCSKINRTRLDNTTNAGETTTTAANIYETVPDQSSFFLSSTTIVQSTTLNEQLSQLEPTKFNLTMNSMRSTMYDNKSQASSVNLRTFKKSQITLNRVILQGKMSLVYEGELKFNARSKPSTDDGEDSEATGSNRRHVIKTKKVLVKMLKRGDPNDGTKDKRDQLVENFIGESSQLANLQHKNLNSILGILEGESSFDQTMSVFKLCELGNLKSYLLSVRLATSEEPVPQVVQSPQLSTRDIIYISIQLVKAVNYLHSRHVIHRDIAVRNCWLDKSLHLKLADSALSSDLFPNDYDLFVCDGVSLTQMPVRWMSLESLKDNDFSRQSDIWSTAVAVWELFTLASQPYEHVTTENLLDHLSKEDNSNRLYQPSNCSDQLFESIRQCWLIEPDERPSVKQLFQALHEAYKAHSSLNFNYV